MGGEDGSPVYTGPQDETEAIPALIPTIPLGLPITARASILQILVVSITVQPQRFSKLFIVVDTSKVVKKKKYRPPTHTHLPISSGPPSYLFFVNTVSYR